MAISRHLAANECLVFAEQNPKTYSSNHTYTLANSCLLHVNLIRNLDLTVNGSLIFGTKLQSAFRLILNVFILAIVRYFMMLSFLLLYVSCQVNLIVRVI
jgi:hypothetical protein